MAYFTISLRDSVGATKEFGTIEFSSPEAARADVRAAVPAMAADLVRDGEDPRRYCFLIADTDTGRVEEIALAETLRW